MCNYFSCPYQNPHGGIGPKLEGAIFIAPGISFNALQPVTIVGIPVATALRGGKAKPSPLEGYTKASA